MPPVDPNTIKATSDAATKAKTSSPTGGSPGGFKKGNPRTGATERGAAERYLSNIENPGNENPESNDESDDIPYTGSGRGQSEKSGLNIDFSGKGKSSNKKIDLKKSGPALIIGVIGLFLIPFLLISGAPLIAVGSVNEGMLSTQQTVELAEKLGPKALSMYIKSGSLPTPFAERLESAGFEVGYLNDSGDFIAGFRPDPSSSFASISTSEQSPSESSTILSDTSSETNVDKSLVLRFKDQILTSANLLDTLESDPEVYNSLKDATFGSASFYFDEYADTFFSEINASRNVFANYTSGESSDFREIVSNYYNNQTDSAYNVLDKKCYDEKDPICPENQGNFKENKQEDAISKYFDYLYENTLIDIDEGGSGEWEQVKKGETNTGMYDIAQATTITYLVNSAVNANETYESMKYSLTIAETISKTMAGEGAAAPINEMMKYLFTADENGISAMQSPTFSSLLTKSFSSYSEDDTKENSIDRIQNLVSESAEALVGEENADLLNFALELTGSSWEKSSESSYSIKDNTTSMIKLLKDPGGTCDEVNDPDSAKCKYEMKKNPDYHPVTVQLIDTLKDALSGNSPNSNTTYTSSDGFLSEEVIGKRAGELLPKGLTILGSKFATYTSGATVGSEGAIAAYEEQRKEIAELDARADRLTRSPFDITSKNTFLGSIIHDFSTYLYTSPSILNTFSSFSSLFQNSFLSLLPGAFADDKKSIYTVYGECPESGESFKCSTFGHEIATFDLDFILNSLEEGSEENIRLNNYLEQNFNGSELKKDSDIKKKIAENNQRNSNPGYRNRNIADQIWKEKSLAEKASNSLNQLFTFLQNKCKNSRCGKLLGTYSENSVLQDYFSTYYARFDEEDLKRIDGTAFINNGEASWGNNSQEAQAYLNIQRILDQTGYTSTANKNKNAVSKYFAPGTGESPYLAILKENATDFSSLSDTEYLATISGMSEKEASIVLGYVAYETYLASIDYENRIAFGREEKLDFENSIQFEETDQFEAELAILVKNDSQKITRKDPTYVA